MIILVNPYNYHKMTPLLVIVFILKFILRLSFPSSKAMAIIDYLTQKQRAITCVWQ